MSKSGQEAIPDVLEWSVGPPGCLGVVGRPSWVTGSGPDTPRRSRMIYRMSGSGRDALQDVREWLRGPTGCPGVVLIPSRMSGSGREALPDV